MTRLFVFIGSVVFITLFLCTLILFPSYHKQVHLKPGYKKRNITLNWVLHHNGNTGSLGNILFSYASITGIANRTKRTPTFAGKFKVLERYFQSIEVPLESKNRTNTFFMKQYGPYLFEEERLIKKLPAKDIVLCCWLQSWKYFSAIESEIQNSFTFKKEYTEKALGFLQKIDNSSSRKSSHNCTFVGVHIRVSQIMTQAKINAGFRTAPTYYYETAMDYFTNKFPNVCFVICTDSWKWVEDNINFQKYDVHRSIFRIAIDDLTLLSSCHHNIISVGTFGWWASYLARGEVIYYHPQVNTKTSLGKNFTRSDFYPPNWRCLTDDPYGAQLKYVRECQAEEQT